MKTLVLFIPVGLLVVYAGYLGLRFGQQPTETEIINRYAAAYVQTTGAGAKATDCAATTHPSADIRMVINCAHPSGVTTTYYVDTYGAAMPPALAKEPAA